ncbi:GET complex subunit get1, partial [Ceratobasidium sp. 395]
MNVRVSNSALQQTSVGNGYIDGDRIPSRYLLLHARGITMYRTWPPMTYTPEIIKSFRVIPIYEEHVKVGLGSAEINMNSIKNRRELTDTIPILELTKQVLETWVDGLTSWELIGWVKEYNDRHQLAEGPEARVNVTIMVKAQTNKQGDFVFRSMKRKRDWSGVLTGLVLVPQPATNHEVTPRDEIPTDAIAICRCMTSCISYVVLSRYLMSVLTTIFILVLLTELVRWVGKSVLLELSYPLYTRLFLKPTIERQRTLRADVLAAKRDLLQTSSQDQFAKWAKLRRRVDRGLAELDTINSQLATARTSFSVKFSTILWTCTTGAQFAIAKHDTPSILVEEHTERPSSPPYNSGTSTASPSPPPENKPSTSTPTSSDEKLATSSTGARGGAGLRARMAARQSAREKE